MRIPKAPFFLLAFMLPLVPCALAQHLNIKNYGPDDGLPQYQVLSAFQDSKGYMWFGTHGGACRYNGKTFEVFDTSDGLLSNSVEDIDEDDRGRICFATWRGLTIYEGNEFKNYHSGNGLTGDFVYDILTENDGSIWVAANGGITRIRAEETNQYALDENSGARFCSTLYRTDEGLLMVGTDKGIYLLQGDELIRHHFDEELDNLPINFIIKDTGGALWIGADRGLFRMRGSRAELVDIEGNHTQTRITSAAIEKDGTLWFGTLDGILCYSNEKFEYYTTENGFSNNTTYSTYIDNEHNIWFGTANGISKMQHGPFIYHNSSSGLAGDSITRIYEDSNQRLWIASWESGITVLEEEKTWLLTPGQGLSDPFVLSMTETPEGKMLIGTVHGIHLWDGVNLKKLTTGGASYILTDSKGRIWIGIYSGIATLEDDQIKVFEDDGRFPNSYVHCIAEDNDGKLWFGTRNEGCYVYDGRKSTIFDKDEGFSNHGVRSIDTDPDGRIWLGTVGDGAFCYDGEKFENFNKEDGLSDNNVWQVLADKKGNVWFGTSSGIDKFDGSRFQHFNINDGLAYNEGSASACLEDSRRRLWFGSIKGLSQYVGCKYDNSAYHPPVYVERFKINNQPADASKPIELGDNENNFEFEFIGLSYRNEKNVRYRFMLAGLDGGWSDTTSKHFVRYAQVPPGTYTFKVEASCGNGTWSTPPASVAITILPPFYQTWWLLATVGISLVALLFTAYRWRINKIKRDKEQLEKIVEERTRAIRASNEELKSFSYSVSHDLQTPIRHIDGFSQILVENFADELSGQSKDFLFRIRDCALHMQALIEDLLKLSRLNRGEFHRAKVDLSEMAGVLLNDLKQTQPNRNVEEKIEDGITVEGDENLLRLVMENLLGNAWKFSKDRQPAIIELGKIKRDGKPAYFVRDNGAGFDMSQIERLFAPFQRLHNDKEYKGTGIGLATVRRIIHRHGGQVWAEGKEGDGATFYFTLS